jgi:proteic killer suppression protein
MIKSIKHKGLRQLYESDSAKLINPMHESRVRKILDILDRAKIINDIDLPGYALHKLKGFKEDRWSVKVSGNWRVTFHFDSGDVYDVNLEDYH